MGGSRSTVIAKGKEKQIEGRASPEWSDLSREPSERGEDGEEQSGEYACSELRRPYYDPRIDCCG